MRTVTTEFILALLPALVLARPPVVILVDLSDSSRTTVTARTTAAANLHRFCAEGVTVLRVGIDMTRPTLATLGDILGDQDGTEPASAGGESWLLAHTTEPYLSLAGKHRLFTADLGNPRWRALQAEFGLPGPLSPAELAVAESIRKRHGPGASEVELTAARTLCSGTAPRRGNKAVFSALAELLSRKPPPPLVIATLQHAYATPEEASATEAYTGRIYEALSAPGVRDETVFVYLNLPAAIPEPVRPPGAGAPPCMGMGCAVLWGKPFRRGFVAIDTVSWPRLRATILSTLGETEHLPDSDSIPAFLQSKARFRDPARPQSPR